MENIFHMRGTKLKHLLIKQGLLKEECSFCGLGPSWQGQHLVLQIDHINGNNKDNNLENLRILCPNCHTQTSTHSGKNKKLGQRSDTCVNCGIPISYRASRCRSCSKKIQVRAVIDWPPIDQILEYLKSKPYTKLAKDLGVSDNGIRKHLRESGVAEELIRKRRYFKI